VRRPDCRVAFRLEALAEWGGGRLGGASRWRRPGSAGSDGTQRPNPSPTDVSSRAERWRDQMAFEVERSRGIGWPLPGLLRSRVGAMPPDRISVRRRVGPAPLCAEHPVCGERTDARSVPMNIRTYVGIDLVSVRSRGPLPATPVRGPHPSGVASSMPPDPSTPLHRGCPVGSSAAPLGMTQRWVMGGLVVRLAYPGVALPGWRRADMRSFGGVHPERSRRAQDPLQTTGLAGVFGRTTS